jgi:murein L,D-transpeptidase YafK
MLLRLAAYSLITIGFLAWYWRQSSPANRTVGLGLGAAISNGSPESLSLLLPGPERVASARKARQKTIKQRCKDAGLQYPPHEVFIRAFKQEGELEVWGRGKADRNGVPEFRRIGVFPVTMSSGKPGPKRREGDLQVPEGCYRVVAFNPESSFHLSLGLDYPNASDKILSDPVKPGYDIYIHGGAVSVGCLPLGDDVIEEVYLLATDVKAKRASTEIPVHIFPARMEGKAWEALLSSHPEHAAFWGQLQPIYAAFEKTKRVPKTSVARDGSYRLE